MTSFFPQGSFFGIDFTGSSLQNFQTAVNVTSDNITNIDTPGASKQVVDLTEAPPIVGSPFMATHVAGTAGEGVLIAQIQRIQSNADDALFRGATASQNYFSTESSTLQSVQSSLGDPNSGISVEYTAFQTAVNQLVSQAGSADSSSAAQQNVLTQAQALATSLNTASQAVSTAQQQTLTQGAATVTQVNGILDQIAALNGSIRASSAAGDSPNTYEDQRDNLIDQLSQYISTQTSVLADGSTLVTVNGQALVNDTVAYHLAAPVIGTASNGQSTFKIDFASTPPAAASAPGIPLGSGQLAALADVYNNKLTVYGQQLDQFASSMSNEVNRVTQGAYDENGQPGAALFQPIVATLPMSAGNIKCGITDPSGLPVVLASTAAGNLTVPMNSANNTVQTTDLIDGDNNLANPPAADVPGPGGTNGALTITVDGQQQTFNYQTNSLVAGANATTINQFITNFNAGQYGVDASFDATSQTIVFARDPANESLFLRGQQQGQAETPDFTLTDTPTALTGGAGILNALGAGAINGVDQNASNAYAASDNGAANALINVFQNNAGIPALETTSAVALTAGVAATIALPAGVSNVQVGQVLTIDAQLGGALPQENVVVTGVSQNAAGIESVTFTPAQNHPGPYTVTSAQVQTFSQFYGNLITQVGLDTQTAITGTSTQTSLASSIDSQRQSYQGINLDEETQNLIEYQSAYQAAARTINTLSQMLDTVINSLGVTSGA